MIPVNPEAIGLFGLFATVICFGLEQLGVGVKGADHEKLTRTLGYIRPDHGRQLWEEGPGNCRPGYGKYDRALGVQYMLGVWDLLDRLDEEKKKG